jgi:hypothetical protein
MLNNNENAPSLLVLFENKILSKWGGEVLTLNHIVYKVQYNLKK